MTQTKSQVTSSVTGKWKAYSAYKDSGVKWLGEIPAQWDISPLKRIAKIRYGLGQPPAEMDEGIAFVRATNVKSGMITTEGMLYVDPTDIPPGKDALLSEGEIIVVRSGAYTGDSAIIPKEYERAIAGYDMVVTITRGHSPYIAWQLLTREVRDLQFSFCSLRAAQPHLNAEDLSGTLLLLPSPTEQQAIDTFLDRETAKINTLIEKKERLIELLREKRSALISHAVTRGLDPTVPMKDSGVEWLGEIPAHWEMLPLRRIVNTFVDYRGFTPTKTSYGVPLITARNIKNGVIDFTNSQEFISEEDYLSRMVRGIPEIGDVLITTEAPLGETAQITDEKISLAQRIILLKVDKMQMINEYLKYYFASVSGKGELWSRSTGSTAIGIKASHLRETFVTVPPLHEQLAIVDLIKYETAKIDALIAKIQEAIEKLKEYSPALISAAVTGKIDVREEIASEGIEA